MKRIIKRAIFSLVLLFCLAGSSYGQAFSFSCHGGYLTGADCQICTGTTTARLFNGLIIRRGVDVFRLIDCPYTVRVQGNNLIFQELIFPNPETVTISLLSSGYSTLSGFKDSTACMCAQQDSAWIGGGGDPSITNEGILGVGAGASNTSVITSNTSTAVGVTITAAGINTISETTSSNGGNITITGTEVDGSTTNELQTIANTSDVTSHTVTLSNSGGSVKIIEGTGIGLSTGGTGLDGTTTITNTAPDQTVSITGAGISVVTGTYPNFTVTSTEVDGSVTNEGSQTVGAGGANTSTIVSNTSGSTPVTVSGSNTILVTESGSTITLQADTSLLATVNDLTREPAYQVVYGTGSGVDSENWFQTDPTDDNIKIGWAANTADTGIVNIAPPSGYSNSKAMFYARDAVNLLKYKRGIMPAWWIQQKAGSNGDGTTNNVLSIDYNQYGGVSQENANDVQFGISMEPHWVTGEGDTVSEFHIYFNDRNGVNHRPFTGFFDYYNYLESYWSFQIENANFPGSKGNQHGKLNINRTNGSTALYPLEVYKHKKTLTTTNTSFTRAELDSATVFVLGNYNTGGEVPQLGLSTLMRWTNTQDRRATFYMGLLDIEGSFDGGTDFIGFHQNSGVFRESFRIADNTGYFGIGLRGGNRPLQLFDVNGTSLHRGSGRFNAPADSSVLFLKSAGAATAALLNWANTTGNNTLFRSTATPESAITANPGDLATTSISSVGGLWIKQSGTGNTGWEPVATGVAANTLKTYYLTRTLQAANNTIELGVFNHTGGGAGYAEVFTVVNNGAGNSIAKKYRIPFFFSNTGGVWQNLLPVANTGAYSGNDFKLEIRSSSTRDTLRVRTVSGSTGGTLLVSIVVTPYQGSSSTFTETTTTWTAPTAVTATYLGNTLSEERQKAGVNTLNPTATFQITGLGAMSSTESFRAQNSSGTRMFTIRDDNRTSIGNNGSPARTLDVTGEVRISDLTTDTPTRLVGADADGDLDTIGIGAEGELHITSGTLGTNFHTTISPAQLTAGMTNNWNPTGLSTAWIIRIDADAKFEMITGIVAPTFNKPLRLWNVSANAILFPAENQSSTAANRFSFGRDVVLFPGKCIEIQYDLTSTRWRLISVAGIYDDVQHLYFNEAFNAPVSGTSGEWSFWDIVSAGSVSATAPVAGRWSGISVSTGSSATGSGYVASKDVFFENDNTSGTANWAYCKAVIKTPASLSDASNDYTVRIGFNAQVAGGGATDGIYIDYNHATHSGNWSCATTNAGNTQRNNSGVAVAASTNYVLEVVFRPNLSAEFFINGTRVATNDTFVPASTGDDFVVMSEIEKSVGTTSRDITVYTLQTSIALVK